MPDRPARYYFDVVTLSHFARIHRLDVIAHRRGVNAIVTNEVLNELADVAATGYAGLTEVESLVHQSRLGFTLMRSRPERDHYRQLLSHLSSGEASCIACATTRGGVVVTDDRAARGSCADHGVLFTGTIGILVAGVRDGVMKSDEADLLLFAMMEKGFRPPVARISDLAVSGKP